jgi:hypothetical protein
MGLAADDSEMGTQSQVALGTQAVCAVGMLGCGFLSNRGDIWERHAIATLLGTVGSVIATFGLALVYYMKIRSDLSRHVGDRQPLMDGAFVALTAQLKAVDPLVVKRVR